MEGRRDPGVFLERKSYRRRRLLDALKLLPFLAFWLFLLPLFWPGDGAETPRAMSAALVYLFGVWAATILACFVLQRAHGRLLEDTADRPGGSGQ